MGDILDAAVARMTLASPQKSAPPAAKPSPPRRVLTEVGAPIQPSSIYSAELKHEIMYQGDLKGGGYPIEQLTRAELEKKARCQRCSRALKGKARNGPRLHRDAGENKQPPVGSTPSGEPSKQSGQEGSGRESMQCKYHTGKVARGRWDCCNQHRNAPGCASERFHLRRPESNAELHDYWRMYSTPPARRGPPIREAVVLDCEMGTAESGDSELIRLSVVDYFTCEVLIDKFIWPSVKMEHYNTKYSGVTKAMMEKARKAGSCFFGKKKARLELWKYVGAHTIIVVHGGPQDFISLRLIHDNVVDTQMTEKFSGELNNGMSLKSLAKERLGREIQLKGHGHDSLEDAIATRDLLHWHLSVRVEKAQKELREESDDEGNGGVSLQGKTGEEGNMGDEGTAKDW